MHFRCSLLCLTIGFASWSAGATTIIPTSQDRFVYVANDRISAPDFAVFDAHIGNVATQYSFIESFLIHGEGEAIVGGQVRSTGTYCGVTFTLDGEVEYRFQGFIRGTAAMASAFSTARLSGPDGVIHEFLAGPQPGPWDVDFDVSGSLLPGHYTLVLSTTAFNGDPSGSSAFGSYNGNFSIVPEPQAAIALIAGFCLLRSRR